MKRTRRLIPIGMPLGGGGDPCALCAGTVYWPERLLTSAGTLFHVHCYRCTVCKRLLHRATYCQDAATGRIYCNPHYGQLATKAGLPRMASGGVDASAGLLWRKRRKAADEEELEPICVGSAVWVDLALAPPPNPDSRRPGLSRAPSSASLLRSGFEDFSSSVLDLADRLGADVHATPFVKAVVLRTGAEGGDHGGARGGGGGGGGLVPGVVFPLHACLRVPRSSTLSKSTAHPAILGAPVARCSTREPPNLPHHHSPTNPTGSAVSENRCITLGNGSHPTMAFLPSPSLRWWRWHIAPSHFGNISSSAA